MALRIFILYNWSVAGYLSENFINMENKNIVVAISILIIVVGSFFYVKQTWKKPEIYQMTRGTLIELKSDSIVVEGQVGTGRKKVEFTITSETILKNNASVFPSSGMKEGQVVNIKTEIRPGNISDFSHKNLFIGKIESKENLSNVDKATAIKIDYATDEFK